jgi:hypothetical protein
VEPLGVGEHVLGPAEADPLGSELARLRGILGRVRVRAHLEPAEPVRPAEHRGEVVVQLRWDERDRPDDHLAGAAVDRDRVALLQLVPGQPGRLRPGIHVQRLAARHTGRTHAARDDGRM